MKRKDREISKLRSRMTLLESLLTARNIPVPESIEDVEPLELRSSAGILDEHELVIDAEAESVD